MINNKGTPVKNKATTCPLLVMQNQTYANQNLKKKLQK
jgi:hypothetical protein